MVNLKNPEYYLDKALSDHKLGYSCAQCIIRAFAPHLGISEETATLAGAGLGAGTVCGELCGVITGMAVAEGFLHKPSCKVKLETMPNVKSMIRDFQKINTDLRCRDLKRPDARKSCDDLISDGVRIFHNRLSQIE